MDLSNRASKISPSLTLAITAKAKKMKESGISVIGFGAGEPDFNTPDYIIAGAIDALNKGQTKYTPSAGILPLREEICKKFLNDNGLEYTPAQIVVSNGAKQSLYNAIQAIIDEGDEVIIPSPYWLTYPELVGLAGGKCVFVKGKSENSYKMTATEFENAITDKTKAVIINSPSNPMGTVYSKDELFAIAKIAEEKGIWIISDEIYEKLVYEGNKHVSIATYSEKVKEKTIVINGVSKTYAMTGWRIGYLAAPLHVAKAIDSMQSHMTSNANSIAQYATLTALKGGKEFLESMHETFDSRRKFMVEKLGEIKEVKIVVPVGAFYVMVDISELKGKCYNGEKINNSIDFADKLLTKGVAVVPGCSFGDDNFIRLSYAISIEDIEEGLNRIKDFISEVN